MTALMEQQALLLSKQAARPRSWATIFGGILIASFTAFATAMAQTVAPGVVETLGHWHPALHSLAGIYGVLRDFIRHLTGF